MALVLISAGDVFTSPAVFALAENSKIFYDEIEN